MSAFEVWRPAFLRCSADVMDWWPSRLAVGPSPPRISETMQCSDLFEEVLSMLCTYFAGDMCCILAFCLCVCQLSIVRV